MKTINRLALFLICGAATLHAVDTPEYDRLRTSYKAAVERATEPLTKTYLAELEKVRDLYTRAANLEAANKVQAEIDAIYTNPDFAKSASKLLQVVPQANVLGAKVEIPANSVNGHKIGPLRKGAVITLSYVSGKWKNNGVIGSDNPDAEVTQRGEAVRLAIANSGDGGTPGAVIAVVPPGTAEKPFSYTMGADAANVVLRINEEGSEYETNPGEVIYKLKVER